MEKATEHNKQWKKVKLGEVGEIVSGGTPSTSNEAFWDGGVLFVTPLDLGRKKEISSTIRTISELGVNNSSANKIKKNSLAISTRAPIGLMSIVNQEFTTNQGCKSIQFFDNYDCQFFYYYLLYNVEQIRRHGQGTTFMEISKTDFANVEISVPSLPAQRRIAAILSSADKVIEHTRQLIGKYKSIKQGMMEDLLKPKEGWKKVKLGDIAQTFTGLTYSPSNINSSGTLVLRSSNIKDGRLCFEDNVFVSMDIPERAMVHEDDILICVRNGSRNLIGKCALITKDAVGMAFGAFMTVLRAITIDPGFLLFIWQSNGIQRQVANNIGATINQITNADFNRFEISVPDLPEQRRIAKILSGIDRKIEAEEKVLEKYEKIKKGLMERVLKKENSIN